MIQKDKEIFPPGSGLDRHFLSIAFRACCYFFSSFHLYCVSSLVSAICEVIFRVFSSNLSKSMQDENRRLCAATVSDIIFPNVATVLWYFEVLLIGIILPQFEGRFKHFLLVIRIIHTSRSMYSYISKNRIGSFFLASDTRQL